VTPPKSRSHRHSGAEVARRRGGAPNLIHGAPGPFLDARACCSGSAASAVRAP